VSGTIGEDTAVDAMRSGAHDYVLKHNLRRLGPAIERELREAANRHQQRQTEAALQLSEQKLQHAQRMESVGRLAAGIAHDFNNLLTVILGFTEFLIERVEHDEAACRDAIEIRTAAQRANALTKQLLAFSRQQVPERQVVDLVAAVADMQPMTGRLIGEDVHCKFDVAGPPQPVLIDPAQFEQVLMNLLVNAKDAMPDGGTLRVSLAGETVDAIRADALGLVAGSYVVLAVSDTGTGIPAETLQYIFEPFFTTKGPSQGTGLGLSTVFGIVRQNGGAIDVHSEIARGATFKVYLPLHGGAPTEAPPVTPVPAAEVRACTILLAEDEPGVRAFLEMALTRAGHTVVTAASGPEAVATGRGHQEIIDLLIADVVMPGLSGPEVADALREAHPRMRTLFLSGYTSHSALPEALLADPGSFLQKPFAVEALMAKVRERLARPS
jgi:signal transduction histidine kinase